MLLLCGMFIIIFVFYLFDNISYQWQVFGNKSMKRSKSQSLSLEEVPLKYYTGCPISSNLNACRTTPND